MDQYIDETVNSTCAVVGFFVNYTVALCKKKHKSQFASGGVRGLEYIAAALPRGQCGREQHTVKNARREGWPKASKPKAACPVGPDDDA